MKKRGVTTVYVINSVHILVGVVSFDDIIASTNGYVKINNKYKYIKGFSDDQAAKISRENSSIDKILVIDNKGVLLADYSRFNDNEANFMDSIFDKQRVWHNLSNFLKFKHIKRDSSSHILC